MLQRLRSCLAEEGCVSFSVRARPHARQTSIVGFLADGSMKVAVAAPAEGGEANAALVNFLAEIFDVRVVQVEIVSGQGGRRKQVRITA